MAAPAVLARAAAAGRALAPSPSPRPPTRPGAPPPDRGGRRWRLWLAASPVALLVGLVVLVLVLLAGVEQQCVSGAPVPGELTGPGSLGGVAGTGLSRAQVRSVREGSPYAGPRVAEGSYLSTAYGPPWGGINGPGAATSGGLAIGGGAPQWHTIAVDPLVIGHGQLVYAWPNPFGWRGPLLAADTGSAIQGRRIDFYDWRGRHTQLAWGHRATHISQRPIAPGSPDTTAGGGAGSGCAAPVSSEVGERIGQLARAQLGQGPSIANFEPPSYPLAWCAWFATNVWRKASVPIPVNGWSGYPYDWAAARGQLFKKVGQPPRGATPPVGSALMYGTDPNNDSDHINLVDRVLPDGSFMVTGGNQDGSRVTRYGPCRLRRADPAGLTGPGCDGRPVYGIAMPSQPGQGT